MSDASGESQRHCLEIWESNCRFGAALHAKKIVCHIWGVPDSDRHMDWIAGQCGELLAVARQYGLDMVAENCVCLTGSPLEHFLKLTERYPDLGITLDTRPAQFHRELPDFMKSPLFHGNIRHIHINDYEGGYKDWNAMYPIPQPGQGNVDFESFFQSLKEIGYAGSITLEAPSMKPDTVDTETLNRSLQWIRNHLE